MKGRLGLVRDDGVPTFPDYSGDPSSIQMPPARLHLALYFAIPLIATIFMVVHWRVRKRRRHLGSSTDDAGF
jgi:hypothetical protein